MEDRRAAPNAGDGGGGDKSTKPERSIRTPGKFARLLLPTQRVPGAGWRRLIMNLHAGKEPVDIFPSGCSPPLPGKCVGG